MDIDIDGGQCKAVCFLGQQLSRVRYVMVAGSVDNGIPNSLGILICMCT